MIDALVIIGTVATAMVVILNWTGAAADLLWMSTIRPKLVAIVAVALMIAIVGVLHAVSSWPTLSPSFFLIAFALVPLASRPFANATAYYIETRIRGTANPSAFRRQDFIFEYRRAEQEAGYEAPEH